MEDQARLALDTRPAPTAARYAVYYTPEPSTALWQLGSSIVGYDSLTRGRVTAPDDERLRPLTDAIQEDPRRYGFHATLRAPFELAEGRTEAELIEAADAFARNRERFSVGPLTPGAMGSFVALMCESAPPTLEQLAADCVTAFEAFRRPLSAPDHARRLKAQLSERQIAHLDAWGYPFVFEEFAFHMTLTGRLGGEDRCIVLGALRELFAPFVTLSEIDAITILVQPSRDAAFHILKRCSFR
jgi:hypothetical protein